jgi:hypothetical protein
MLRLHFATGDLMIDHRAALAPARSLACLDSEDEIRRLLLLALTNPTALHRLRRFWADWHSESHRVTAIDDRRLIDRVARMAVNGPLAAYVVHNRPSMHPAHVAQKLGEVGRVQKQAPATGPPPAYATNVSTVAPKSGSLAPTAAAGPGPVAAPALAASNLARSAPVVDPNAPKAGMAASYDVETLSPEKRIEQVLRRVPPYLPEAMRADFMKILEPQALVITVAVLAVWAASHPLGIGFIVDALLLVTALIFMGKAVIDCAETLRKSLQLTSEAKEEKHLEESAKLLAQVIATIGVTAFVAVIARGASRTVSAAAQGKTPKLREGPDTPLAAYRE